MIPLSYSKKQQDDLYIAYHQANKQGKNHLSRVILSLILIGEKKPLKDIARLINVTVKTLFNWMKKFMCHGMSLFSMHWFKGRGRKSKLSKTDQKELKKMIEEGSLSHGFTAGGWNTAMINELIKLKFKVSYNERYLPRLLKKIGLSYQKAKFISDRLGEEEYHLKREKWINETLPETLKKAKEKEAIVLFGDEVSFAMWGSLGRTWAVIGKQPVVKTTGIRKGLKIFGAMEIVQGDFHYRESFQYRLTQKAFTTLRRSGMPIDVVKSLKSALNKETYRTEFLFLAAVKNTLTLPFFQEYQETILQLAEVSGRFNGESYVEFLRQLVDYYNKPVILIEDGASYHGGQVVKDFLAENTEQLSLVRLPPFSPDYNPIEKLWKNTKRDATHLKYFKHFEDLRESVVTTFKSYLNDASKVLCLATKMRKEHDISL